MRKALDASANRDYGIAGIERGPSSAQIERVNGSTDTVSWQGGKVWIVSFDKRGVRTWSRESETTKKSDKSGSVYTTKTTHTNGTTTVTGTTTDTVFPDHTFATDHEWTSVTKDGDTTITVNGSESTAPDGQTHKTEVTTTCTGDDCTTKVEESDPPEQTCGITFDCQDGGGESASVDPDAGGTSPVISTEGAVTALIVLGATVRTIQPDGSSVDMEPNPSKVDRWGPVSIGVDEALAGGVFVFRGYNEAGPEFVRGVMQPEVGPPGPERCTTCN